jgi:hypothetical protein
MLFTFGTRDTHTATPSASSSSSSSPSSSSSVFTFGATAGADVAKSPLSVALEAAAPFSFAASPLAATSKVSAPSAAAAFAFTAAVDVDATLRGLKDLRLSSVAAKVAATAADDDDDNAGSDGGETTKATFSFAVRPSDLCEADRDLLGSALLSARDDPAALAFRRLTAGRMTPTKRQQQRWVRGLFMGCVPRLAPTWRAAYRTAVAAISATDAVRMCITSFVDKEAWAWAQMRLQAVEAKAAQAEDLANYLAVVKRSAAESIKRGGADAERHAAAMRAAALRL